jgi:hypothetical protein
VSYLYLPFVFQGILMGIDERLHMKRGLGLWERLGHPLDTLTVFVPISYIAMNDYSQEGLILYISLALFSSLFITKDEFIHSLQCPPFENWLHSLLFVTHPLIFLSSGVLWKYHPSDIFLSFQPLFIGAFMLYQILKWSIPWKKFWK